MPTTIRSLVPIAATAMLVCVVGCGPEVAEVQPEEQPRKLREVDLLVVDDPALAEAISRQWSSKADTELNVTETTAAELLARTTPPKEDAIVYPAGMLGELAERNWLDPFPEAALESNAYAATDVLLLPRNYESKWAGETLAVPFSSPILFLAVRTDLFEAEGIEPPESWAEYYAAAQAFAEPPPGVEGAWTPTVEPVGETWAAETLLARAAPFVRDPGRSSTLFNLSTMEPQIAAEPFVESLTAMAAIAKSGDETITRNTPLDAQRAILAGRCAMAITWPLKDEEADASNAPPISYFPLPGAGKVWRFNSQRWDDLPEVNRAPFLGADGRLASVVRDTSRSRSAGMALALLSGQEWSPLVCSQCENAGVFRSSHTSNLVPWADSRIDAEARTSYSNAVIELQTSNLFLFSPRIPGSAQYMNSLNQGVARVLNEGADPSQSLKAVADEWRNITEKLGVNEQKEAYRKSLGIR